MWYLVLMAVGSCSAALVLERLNYSACAGSRCEDFTSRSQATSTVCRPISRARARDVGERHRTGQ